ncbi:MAG: DUF2804 domain-containing protein [bacterium]
MQTEITQPGPLLDANGSLLQVGWARHQTLDCNLENARFYALRGLQRYRIKRWDYYAVFTPQRFFSATVADLGYAGNIFVYTIDFATRKMHEESLVVPFGKGVVLPRNSTSGDTHFENEKARLDFTLSPGKRHLSISWKQFLDGKDLAAEIDLVCPDDFESMNIVIPIGKKRFYYNRKINSMPASGSITIGSEQETLDPVVCAGSLDWGRGVWEYSSYWNWASASGFLPDGRTVGLNLGCGFGDLSRAGENALILDNRIHKLGVVPFDYTSSDYMQPWHFRDSEGRLDVTLTPFLDRTATTKLLVIDSEVHQMFGLYNGTAVSDSGETIRIENLVGFAEEHHARW